MPKNFTKGTGGQSSVSIPYYYISTNANSETVNYDKFGCLYNWAAAMDTTVGNKLLGLTGIRRGICPEGWHIPADVEWYELEKQVANKTLTSEAGRSGYSNSFDAGRLAAGCDWGTAGTSILRPQCYNLVNRNSTLFSALPAGVRNSGGFAYVKVEADFWSSTEAEATKVYRRLLHKDNDGVSRAAEPKDVYGFSVRCVRDVETTVADIQIGKVTCSSVNVATKMLTGIVTDTVKVLVSTHSNFSDTVDVKTLTIPTDSLLSTDFYDLKTNTTYYVRIADKSANFTTKLCACDVLQVRSDNEHAVEDKVYEVADADGNWYGVVQIGNQCWLRENMRCTTSPKTGDRIVTNNGYSTLSRSAKWYANDSTQYAKYGLLYNACAALDVTRNANDPAVAASNSAVTTGWTFTTDTLVQGVCPTGWHLPTDTEWTRMENYIVTDGHYNLSLTPSPAFASKNYAAFPNDGYNEGTNTPVSPMLAYLDTWTASNTIRATASADTNRNKVQFEAKAAGYFLNNNTEAGIGNYAAFWTATPTGNNMFIRQMRNSTAGIGRLNAPKSYDISVRCVRDALYPEFTICTDTVNGTISLSTAKYTYKVEVINSNSAVVRTKYYAKPHSEFSKLPTGTYVVKATSKSGHVIMDTVDVVYTPTSCIVDSLKKNEFGLENRLDSVADHQGNKYVVVQVGNQCWMRENMRATTLPSGRTLGVCTENGHAELNAATVGPYCFLNLTSNGHPDFYEKYGCMYNWIAVMDTTNNANNTQITVDFPHRGICPDGWHVPEASEFVALFNYVVKDNHYGLDITASPAFDDASKVNNYVGTNTPISAMLAGGCDWTPTTNGNMAGSDAPYKNITRFSLTPGRSWTKGNFDAVYDYGASWTSTQSSATNILYYHIAATAGTGVFRYNGLKKYELAQSVRCVRNN